MGRALYAPEGWIDTFASQRRLDELRSRVLLDITGDTTPSGMREFDWDEAASEISGFHCRTVACLPCEHMEMTAATP